MKTAEKSTAPYPGSHAMPQWTTGELPEAPVFTWKNWIGMIGPGLVMGAAAIGGGEWTLGPKVTAQYGGTMLWLAALSIMFQVFYNVEICRYTLYSGEPIFTGKFRIPPGPLFWVFAYLLVDWGSFFPYLVTNAAIPLYVAITGEQPSATMSGGQYMLHKGLTLGLFTLMLVPLIFGGKVYNSLKAVMTFKLIYVLGLLIFISVFYSHIGSWIEILSGFFQIGNVPVKVEDGARPEVVNLFTHWSKTGTFPAVHFAQVAYLCGLAAIAGNGGLTNAPVSNFVRDQGWGMGKHVGAIPSVVGGRGIELSHEGCVFHVTESSLVRWHKWVWHIAREQLFVWLPACIIGVALPSILSVEFLQRGAQGKNDWNLATMTAEGVQKAVAEPKQDTIAAKIGLANLIASPTAGWVFFKLILLCGFIVLITSGISTADGFVRRWVDLIWVAVPKVRMMENSAVRYVYFGVLMFYFVVGFTMLLLPQAPGIVTKIATTGYNFAFAISSWHTLVVNTTLLPRELRPNWLSRVSLVVGGCFFIFLGMMGALDLLGAFAVPKT